MITYNEVKSRYAWYVSGTPFPNGIESIKQALKFINFKVNGNNIFASYYNTYSTAALNCCFKA